MSSLSGSGTWVGSTGIRVGSAHLGEEDACDACARLCAWAATPPARDGAFRHFRRPISTRFSTVASFFLLYTVVWSKNNFDKFHFWAKIKHPFKPYALIPIVGDSDR